MQHSDEQWWKLQDIIKETNVYISGVLERLKKQKGQQANLNK
jgi:hypothetical protein